ncbi:MAG: hypothetical protein [Bacteriophage sp.]|nr:MAG: hypothetical protein [Bacteriophage sp.]
MKLGKFKINSSVVKFHAIVVVLCSVAIIASTWFSANKEVLATILSPVQYAVVTMVFSLITIVLRTTNVQGKPPVEIVTPAVEEKPVDSTQPDVPDQNDSTK